MSGFPLLPEGYTYLRESSEGTLKVRIAEVRDEAGARAWLKELQAVSYVTWRVGKTYPHSGRVNLFQLRMRCQHKTDPRAQHTKRPHKHTGCSASLHIVVKRVVKYSRSHNAAKNNAYPTIVLIDPRHNHSIDNAAALKFRDMSPETKQTLLELFHHGHAASSALHCLKTDLLLKHGDEYFRVAADGHFVPSVSRVQKLYDSEFKREYGAMSGEDMFSDLEKLLRDYCDKDDSGIAKFGRVDNHYFVAICSPVMARAHRKVIQTSELVMVDAAGGMDKQRHRVYFFVSPTAAGGIPLGVIVSSSEQQCVFEAAVSCLKTCFPEDSFYGKKCPKVILTDNDLKERQVLKHQFPGSQLMLCVFHILKAVWSWLRDARHSISDRNDRQDLYSQFKSMVYATDTETLDSLHNMMVASSTYAKYPKFQIYLSSMWNLRSDWAQCYRKNLPMRGSNTTNYVEIVFRVLKDNILDRTQAFNLTQLVDFILTRYEAYVMQRLLDFCNGRYTKSLLRNMLPDPAGISPADVSEVSSEVGTFIVNSQNPATPTEIYTVDIVRGFCSCWIGNSGKLCKHASAVLQHLDRHIFSAYNTVSMDTRSQLFEVALGSTVPTGWLADLQDCPLQSASVTSTDLPCTSSVDHSSKPLTDEEMNSTAQLTVEEQGKLQKTLERLNTGLASNPNVFVPAVRKMLNNIDHHAVTEAGLVSAISTFGKYSGVPAAYRRRFGAKIGVQPTAIGRRKVCLTGRRRLGPGRLRQDCNITIPPGLQVHDYTSFGNLPVHKRKAPHNLQACVYRDAGLGCVKHVKLS